MAIPNCNVNTNVISNLADAPTLTSAELKAKFDKEAKDIKDYINEEQNPEIERMIQAVSNSILNKTYPVGSIYMSVTNISPETLFGGTWELLRDRFLLGSGNNYDLGTTGGEAEHTLTVEELPPHNHLIKANAPASAQPYSTGSPRWPWQTQDSTNRATENTGGGEAHNNMPPYLVVNMWKRIS